jgi:hypothetical protein
MANATPIQLLRSEVPNKRPDPARLLPAQPAANISVADPGLYIADSNSNLVKIGPCSVGTIAPNTGAVTPGALGNTAGELWLDTSETVPKLRVFDGSNFVFAMPQYAQALTQDTTPNAANYVNGTMWFDTSTGLLYVLYNTQWVQTSSATVS